MEIIKKCINCNSEKIISIYQVPDRHYNIKGNFDLGKCISCGLVFMNPMPNNEELSKFYAQDTYYSFHIDIYKENSMVKKFFKTILFQDFTTKDPKFKNKGKILDIGCGNGWVLYQYKKIGWEVAGAEPSAVAAEIGNKVGLNISTGDLISANFKEQEFDYIRSNHSFEHIFNPIETLSEIHRVLKYDGKVFIGIPNIGGLNAKIFKKYWYYLGAPVHTFNYNPENITQIMEKNGFKVKEIKYNSSWAGILGSMQIYLNRNSGKTSDKGLVFNFIGFRIIAGILAKIQNILQLGDCMEVIAIKK